MLMVSIKFIREMFTLYPGFSSEGTWGFCEVPCVWYLAVGHLLNPVNTAFSRPLEAHSFLPASPRQNTLASSLLEMAWKAFFIFSNLKERFIIRKTRAATPFPEHFLWLFPPGSIWPCLGAVSGWGGGRWGEFHGLLWQRGRKGEEKRTWISSKECLWRYLSLPCCCAGTFYGWKCSIGFDLSQYSVETGGAWNA